MDNIKTTLKLQNLISKYNSNEDCKIKLTLICNVYSILYNNPIYLKENSDIMRIMYENIPKHLENLNKYNIKSDKAVLLFNNYADLVEFILNKNIH